MTRLKNYLFTGLIVVVPVFLTFYVLFALFNFLDGILGSLIRTTLNGLYFPGLGFICSLALIVLVGFTVKQLMSHSTLMLAERAFSGLPLIGKIYPAFKQVVLFVSQQKQYSFKKVVLVEYPRKGAWTLGFLTNDQFDALSRATGREVVSVFVSTTPGPLSGNVLFFPKEDVLFPDITVNEALNIILSGGVFRGQEAEAARLLRESLGQKSVETDGKA